MNKFSISEFVKFINKFNPKLYIFDIGNQPWSYTNDYALELSASFEVMLAFPGLGEIYFKDNNSTLGFRRVKCVRISGNTHTYKLKFDIVCRKPNEDGEEISFRFIAEK